MDIRKWLIAMCALIGSTNAAEDTAQRKEPIIEDRPTLRFLERFNLTDKEVGVYYVPPVDGDTRGFIFDDIPRETITTQAHLTEKRIKKEGSFVRFNHRQISYSLMETRDDSFRMNLYPTKKAFMLNWTHAIPVLGD